MKCDAGKHRLAPLITPRSIAIVGASPRAGSVQRRTIEVVTGNGFDGTVHAVNPNYDEVLGIPCAPSVGALPNPPDLAVLVVGAQRMEAVVDEAIAGGARALAIFDSCYLDTDTTPALVDRLKEKIRDSCIPVCGGNGMGFFDFERDTYVSYYQPPKKPPGDIAVIAHSGSVFDGLVYSDSRYRFNLAISPGQELGATIGDYMDYALELESTRVIALFVETVRDVGAFVNALQKAHERDVAVVAVKAGRTIRSAAMARTHSGALVGNARAFDAVLERYGGVCVQSADELLATSALLGMRKRADSGGLSVMIDSGGLRETLVDLADERAITLSKYTPATTDYLASMLPSYLSAENPLDYGVPHTVDRSQLLTALWDRVLADPGTAIGGFQFEIFDDFGYAPGLVDTAVAIAAKSPKPFFVFNSFHCTQNNTIAAHLADHGLPMINGEANVLAAVGAVLRHRDLNTRNPSRDLPVIDEGVTLKWRERLRGGGSLDEAEALVLLSEFGIEAIPTRVVTNRDTAVNAAQALGYPVVVKTGEPGIDHKSDRGGVHLGLRDAAAVTSAYDKLALEFGPRAIIEPMAGTGVELAFGAVVDPQFGPMVMVGMGGTLVELLSDTVVALAPFDAAEANRLLERLKGRRLLDGVRGAPSAQVTALAQALARFSVLAMSLRGELESMDVNPIIVGPTGAVAVDALLITKS